MRGPIQLDPRFAPSMRVTSNFKKASFYHKPSHNSIQDFFHIRQSVRPSVTLSITHKLKLKLPLPTYHHQYSISISFFFHKISFYKFTYQKYDDFYTSTLGNQFLEATSEQFVRWRSCDGKPSPSFALNDAHCDQDTWPEEYGSLKGSSYPEGIYIYICLSIYQPIYLFLIDHQIFNIQPPNLFRHQMPTECKIHKCHSPSKRSPAIKRRPIFHSLF